MKERQSNTREDYKSPLRLHAVRTASREIIQGLASGNFSSAWLENGKFRTLNRPLSDAFIESASLLEEYNPERFDFDFFYAGALFYHRALRENLMEENKMVPSLSEKEVCLITQKLHLPHKNNTWTTHPEYYFANSLDYIQQFISKEPAIKWQLEQYIPVLSEYSIENTPDNSREKLPESKYYRSLIEGTATLYFSFSDRNSIQCAHEN